MGSTNDKHGVYIRWLTGVGAILGCSVLIMPLLGFHGPVFHLTYGFLYLIFSSAYAWCVISTGRQVPGLRWIEAKAGRWVVTSLMWAMVLATAVYSGFAVNNWLQASI